MDEDDNTMLKCDVELNVAAPSLPTANRWVADALRRLADRLEREEFDDGLHDVADGAGKKIGTIYVDYSTEIII